MKLKRNDTKWLKRTLYGFWMSGFCVSHGICTCSMKIASIDWTSTPLSLSYEMWLPWHVICDNHNDDTRLCLGIHLFCDCLHVGCSCADNHYVRAEPQQARNLSNAEHIWCTVKWKIPKTNFRSFSLAGHFSFHQHHPSFVVNVLYFYPFFITCFFLFFSVFSFYLRMSLFFHIYKHHTDRFIRFLDAFDVAWNFHNSIRNGISRSLKNRVQLRYAI